MSRNSDSNSEDGSEPEQSFGTSRRNYMKGMAGFGALASIGSFSSSSEATENLAAPDWSNATGQSGTESKPFTDVWAQHAHHQTVDTDDLRGKYTEKIRVIVDGEVFDTVDPSSSSAPLNDAIDTAAAEGGGLVKRPAKLVEQNVSVKPKENVSVTGPDIRKDGLSGVKITTAGESGIEFTEQTGSTIQDYGHIEGTGMDVAQGPAIHWNGGYGGWINFGHIRVDQWGGKAWMDEPGSNPYQIRVPSFLMGASVDPDTNGDVFGMDFNSLHPTLFFGHITVQVKTQMTGIAARGADLKIGSAACGRATDTLIDHRDGYLECGWVEHEPSERTSKTAAVFRLTSERGCYLHGARLDAQEDGTPEDIQYLARLDGCDNAYVRRPHVKSAPGYVNDIDVASAPSGRCWFVGDSADVNDRAAAGTNLLTCLGDLTTTA